jgi:hypothetical protein
MLQWKIACGAGGMALLVAVAAGCNSSDATPAGAAGSCVAGSAGAADAAASDSAPEAAEAEAGGQDAALHPGPFEACDFLEQNCAAPAAPKCRVDFTDQTYVATMCDELLGTAALDEECTRPDDTVGVDTCDQGLFCANVGQPYSNPQKRVCRTLCDRSSMCEEGRKCQALNVKPDGGAFPPDLHFVGVCYPCCCDFFDTSTCPAGTTCLTGNSTENEALPLCSPSKGAKKGEACTSNNDCANGHGCVRVATSTDKGTCQPWCGNAHPACDPAQTCLMFDTARDIGLCMTMPDS